MVGSTALQPPHQTWVNGLRDSPPGLYTQIGKYLTSTTLQLVFFAHCKGKESQQRALKLILRPCNVFIYTSWLHSIPSTKPLWFAFLSLSFHTRGQIWKPHWIRCLCLNWVSACVILWKETPKDSNDCWGKTPITGKNHLYKLGNKHL